MSYGEAAVYATHICKQLKISPMEAWSLAVQKHIQTRSGQMKGCPKGAFLGLCSQGQVRGILPGKYTRSVDNRGYAITAVKILKNQPKGPIISAGELWDQVMVAHEKSITSNSQMDVVLALWQAGLILIKQEM